MGNCKRVRLLARGTFTPAAVDRTPTEHLIGDKARDSDDLDNELEKQGVEMTAAQRGNRKLKTQDRRALRRDVRGWLVGHDFAWRQWKRRVLVRWASCADTPLGFVQLAAITVLLKRF